jgi:DNA-binding response OmpR family regulator
MKVVLAQRWPRHTVTILVVDDDQAVAELSRELLNDIPGWGATVVHDAAAARAVFSHVKVEVLVLDVNLPRMGGLRAARAAAGQ